MKKHILIGISALAVALTLAAAVVPSVFGTLGQFRWFYVSASPSTIPYGVNTQGTIVGTYRLGTNCFGVSNSLAHGFRTNNFGATIDSFDVPGAASTEAGGVNDLGVIAGTYQTGCDGPNDPPNAAATHGYRLQDDTFTSFDLPATTSVVSGDPLGGPVTVPVRFPRIHGINNYNDIVGGFLQTCGNANPFRPADPACVARKYGFILRSTGSFQVIDACNQLVSSFGPGCTPGTTEANGINDNSTVVGSFQDQFPGGPNADRLRHGFIYQGGTSTPILCNGDRNLNTEANGINNQGIIVGACDSNAFVLLPPYKVADFRIFSFTPNFCPLGGMSIKNTVARGISNDNKIVGSVRCEDAAGVAQIFGFEINLSDIDASAAPGQGTVASVTIVPNPVTGGNSAIGTVVLSAPAGPGGVLVTLISNNPAAGVPASITIPQGQTTGTFPVSTTAVNTTVTATIGATSSNTVSTPLVINPASGPPGTIGSVSIAPNPVTGGSSAIGTITLTAPAGPGGVVVTLTSTSGAAGVPATITIPQGQSTAIFPVTTTAVNISTTATIGATSSSNTVTTPLVINPAGGGSQGTIGSVTIVPNPVAAGNSATGTVTLTAPAGSGGVVVTLGSNNGAAGVPATVTIPQGQTTATFPVTTTSVNTTQNATISATSSNTATTPLTITPVNGGPGQGTIGGVSVVPNPVTGGTSATGTVTLTAAAGPGGVLVTLGSNNGAAGVPGSITIPQGQTTGTFPVTTTPVNTTQTATISATSSNTATTPLTINPSGPGQGSITGVSIVPNPVSGGNSATGTVTLSAPAGAGGVLVTLGSNNGAAGVPGSITIPQGQTTGTFPVTTTPVNTTQTATISATSSNTATTPLTINPSGPGQGNITGVSVVPNPVTGGNSATGTVTLSAPAGAGGVLVTLGSNNGAAGVPATITILQGQTTGTFPVTTTAVSGTQAAIISATSSTTATTPLTINPVAPGQGNITGISLVPNPVTGGNTSTATVTLASPAGPGGVLVTLTSSNPAATVQTSIIIPQGQSSGTFPVTTTPVNSTQTSTITATSANSASAPLTINPGGAGQGTITGVSVVPNPVIGGNSATGTVTLASPAAAGGVLVTLGSNIGSATVPSSITIQQGQSSATFPVTTTPVNSQQTATISATSGNTATTPLIINPGGPGQGNITGVSVVPNPVAGGNSATGTVTLSAPAGAGGVLVTLSSNNGTAGVPASITIPQGQSTGTFPVATTPVNSQQTATISATSSNTASTPLIITPGGPGQGNITGVSVVPNPVTGGNSATGTVTLSAPAGTGGVLVTLGSNNLAAGVPASITIPQGQASGTFPVTTTPVNAQQTATISATSGNTAATALTINPASPGQGTITGVSVVPNPVTGGNTVTGTVTLSAPAGPGGVLVGLGSNNVAAGVPASITIPQGQSTGTFPVTTTAVNAQQTATITATSGNTATTPLTINPAPAAPCVGSLNLAVNAVPGGNPVTGTVTLTGPAPQGGSTVQLLYTGAGVTGPASILVPQGSTTGTFQVSTASVATIVNSTIQALTGPCPGVTVNLTVTPPAPVLTSVSVVPGTVNLGSSALGTVSLSGVSASDTVVNLSSNIPGTQIGIAATVTIPAGASSAAFNVSNLIPALSGILNPVTGLITATAGGVSVNAPVTLKVTP